jgi:anaerobic magnesium-protoporphyrin IX monomethyl ester cyclase
MKVMLINPFCIVPRSWMPYAPQEPLALEYLAAVASPDHDVRILDCRAEYQGKYKALPGNMFHVGATVEQVRAAIAGWQPDLVGVTAPFTTQIRAAHTVLKTAKDVDRQIITVVGGCSISCYPTRSLEENPSIDIAVTGEGELTFRELLDRAGGGLDEIDGIVYRKGERIIANRPRGSIDDLDEIPFPRRDLVPFEHYSSSSAGIHKLRALLNALRFRDDKARAVIRKIIKLLRRRDPGRGWHLPSYGRAASVVTSRGCPFNCYFCAVRNVWGNTYRMRSPENVLDELTLLYKEYGVRHFGIVDDNFNISKKRTLAICQGVIDRGLDVTFRADSGLYLSNLDEETLSLMKRAGFHELYFGIESGNEWVLQNVIDKKVDLAKVREVAQLCKEVGIVSGGYFMVGVPGETRDTMEETVRFAVDSGLDRIRLYTCQPFPGSRLYEDCEREGWIPGDFDASKGLIFDTKAYIETNDFSPEDVTLTAEKGRATLRQQRRLDM